MLHVSPPFADGSRHYHRRGSFAIIPPMHYGKPDANQERIVAALRRVPGCRVAITSGIGKGFPDLVVGFMGKIVLLEVKDGTLPPSKRKLTPDEKKFHQAWEGLPVYTVSSIDEALMAIGVDSQPHVPF
jgi:hypothetical protein